MNMYFVWPVAIGSYLVLGVGSFLYFEIYAIKTGRPTLSRYVWELTDAHPFVVMIAVGLLAYVAGFLTDHFWGDGFKNFAAKISGG